MILSIFFLLLSCLILPLHGAFYYLVIPYGELYNPNRTGHFFKYSRRIFSTYSEMAKKIVKDFPHMSRAFVLLQLRSVTNGNSNHELLDDGMYSKLDDYPKRSIFKLPRGQFPIKAEYHNSKIVYSCEGNMYATLKGAKECIDDLRSYYRIETQRFKLGKHSDSVTIWKNVWGVCFYQCFIKDNHKRLSKYLLKELNFLRKLLNLNPVKCSDKMKMFAERRHMVRNGMLTNYRVKMMKNPYKELTANVDPPFASTQMNTWFNQYKVGHPQRQSNKRHSKYFQKLYLLFSNNIKEVCFGAVKEKNKLLIVCEMQ